MHIHREGGPPPICFLLSSADLIFAHRVLQHHCHGYLARDGCCGYHGRCLSPMKTMAQEGKRDNKHVCVSSGCSCMCLVCSCPCSCDCVVYAQRNTQTPVCFFCTQTRRTVLVFLGRFCNTTPKTRRLCGLCLPAPKPAHERGYQCSPSA